MKILAVAGAGVVGYALFFRTKEATLFGTIGGGFKDAVKTVEDTISGFANWFGGDSGNQTVKPLTPTGASARTTTESPVKNTAFA